MKLSAKKSSTKFEPCPEFTGRAVCVDVTAPKLVHSAQYGDKMKFRLVFEVDQEKESDDPKRAGERHCVWSSGFTESLHEKAGLRKFLKQWLGRDLNAQELDEFDTESLIGKPAFIVVTHSTGDEGQTYANITACTPYKGKDPLAPSGKFTREKDREKKDGEQSSGGKAEYRKADGADEDDARDDWQKCKVHVGRHKGVEVGDLDEDAIKVLAEKWLPTAKANQKPTADDKRLIAALEAALAEIAKDEGAGSDDPATDY